jgi:glucokinase
MKNPLSIGVDVGGTHIACAAVDLVTGQIEPGSLFREEYSHEGPADAILRSWAAALNRCLSAIAEVPVGIGFAIPGPFDYRTGTSKMEHKFKSLFGLNIPAALGPLLTAGGRLPMRFLNDASSFAVGEAWQGEGRGFRRVVVVTLGTGFGSAFLNDGVPVVSGGEVPPEGCLWHLPFRDGLADDYFSTRWFIKAYREKTGETIDGVKPLIEKAASDASVRELFTQFGRNLAECLAPWLRKFDAEILIAGGNIARALPLFEAGFKEGLRQAEGSVPLAPSYLMEKAALIGSARLTDDAFWERVAADLPQI